MTAFLVQLHNTHSAGFVVTAALVCLVAACLVVVLLEQGRTSNGWDRAGWMGLTALVAGLGVWTTHFVAMLGFRVDILLGYDQAVTIASLGIAILLVGMPIAATVLVERRAAKAVCGALAGAGVSAMHFTGMAGIEGCTVEHAVSTLVAASLAGIALMTLAFALGGTGKARLACAGLFVAAVCATHFTAMSQVTLTGFTAIEDAVDPATLGIFVTAIAAVLFLGAIMWLVSVARIDANRRNDMRLLSTALHNMSNGLMLIDASGKVRVLNERLAVLYRFQHQKEDIGLPWRDFVRRVGAERGWSARWIEGVIDNYARWMAKASATASEHVTLEGTVLRISCRPLSTGGAVFTYDDVTTERVVQKQVAHLAYHDDLTGLPNRRTFQARIDAMLEQEEQTSLLMVDLDRFKQVNDTLGHSVGDELLIEVSRRIRQTMDAQDFAARLGGDELAVLHPGGEASAQELAERLVETLGQPAVLAGTVVDMGASIGIATALRGDDPSLVVQQADLALYRAKARGRGLAEHYTPGLHEEATRRREMESALSAALGREEFFLVYQPLYQLPDRELIGFEALIRWRSERFGLVSPADFIPLAEDTGDIVAIGEWVLKEACRHAATLPDHLHIAVNVSPVQLHMASIMTHVTAALSAAGLAPHRLEIELTETAMVRDGGAIAEMLASLRALGIRIAMDDFGTGYSSLTHLCDFALDRIKIDRSFLEAAHEDVAAMAVLRAITQMGRDLGVLTIAEGVETDTQIALLEELGCNAAQGFRLGRPMSGEDTLRLVKQAEALPLSA